MTGTRVERDYRGVKKGQGKMVEMNAGGGLMTKNKKEEKQRRQGDKWMEIRYRSLFDLLLICNCDFLLVSMTLTTSLPTA